MLGRPLIRLRRGPWVERPKPFPEREREIYRLCFFYTCSSFPRRCEGPPLSWAVNITTNANLFHDVPIGLPIMFDSDLKLLRLVLVKASKGYWITYYSSFSSNNYCLTLFNWSIVRFDYKYITCLVYQHQTENVVNQTWFLQKMRCHIFRKEIYLNPFPQHAWPLGLTDTLPH